MKLPNVSSVLLMGPLITSKSSFLLQGAIHYAEQGLAVTLVSAREFESLPPPIHGLSTPGPDVFSLIRFLYLPRWQDLLQHLSSLHLHAHVPSVIMVEALEHYCLLDSAMAKSQTQNETNHTSSDASHCAFICAALLDGAAVCAVKNRSIAHLVVTLGEQYWSSKFQPIVDIYFTDIVWLLDSNEHPENCESTGKEITVTRLDTPYFSTRQFQFSFTSRPDNGSLVLSKVLCLCDIP